MSSEHHFNGTFFADRITTSVVQDRFLPATFPLWPNGYSGHLDDLRLEDEVYEDARALKVKFPNLAALKKYFEMYALTSPGASVELVKSLTNTDFRCPLCQGPDLTIITIPNAESVITFYAYCLTCTSGAELATAIPSCPWQETVRQKPAPETSLRGRNSFRRLLQRIGL